jgi:hypothetical protein
MLMVIKKIIKGYLRVNWEGNIGVWRILENK